MAIDKIVSRMKRSWIIGHDLTAVVLAFVFAVLLRFDGANQEIYLARLPWIAVAIVAIALPFHIALSLHTTRWRLASVPDLVGIVKFATFVAVSILVLDYVLVSPYFVGEYVFGRQLLVVWWLLMVVILGAPRLAYRKWRDTRLAKRVSARPTTPTLVVGRGIEVDNLLRGIESGSIGGLRVIGLVSSRASDVGSRVRGMKVTATVDDLSDVIENAQRAGEGPRNLVVCPSIIEDEDMTRRVFATASRYGIVVSRVQEIEGERDPRPRLLPFTIENLLLRPTVEVDPARLEPFAAELRFAITGGGGSIGGEIARRLVRFGAREVIILENSEYALYTILEQLRPMIRTTVVTGRICDIRDKERVHALLRELAPDVVFHAAALKHVDLLEENWMEAIKTNIIGSVNVAEAAAAIGTRAMVMISTDKAVKPVSVLGATKRFAEMYVQAREARREGATRFVAVRFGNVLGSSGSVVPKFKAQIEKGGPVTVTDPDVVRYFMTISEAADLVVTASAHAIGNPESSTAVYVLNMGQPVRIIDMARRMIELAGLEPERDIPIRITGLRPGERLSEIVLHDDEPTVDIGIEGIVGAAPSFANITRIEDWIADLERAIATGDRSIADRVLNEALPTYPIRLPAD